MNVRTNRRRRGKSILRKAVVCLIVVFLLLLLPVGWGIYRWQMLSHTDGGGSKLAAWNLCAKETAYFYYVPDVMKLDDLFLKYHGASLKSPEVAAARKMRSSLPPLISDYHQSIPEHMLEAMKSSGEVALFDFFTAIESSDISESGLGFLIGGRCVNASLSEWLLRRSLREAKVEGIAIGTTGEWLLVSDSAKTLEKALQRAGNTTSRSSLGGQKAFRESRETYMGDALLWIYAGIPAVVKSAETTGLDGVADLLGGQNPGLLSASWGWHSGGKNSPAHDLLAFTLSDEMADATRQVTKTLPQGVFADVPDDALTVGAFNIGEIASQPDVATGPYQRVVRKSSPTGVDLPFRPWEASGSLSRPAGWLKEIERLESRPDPFFEMRINYPAIVSRSLERAAENWSEVSRAMDSRGIPASEQPPQLDVKKWFGMVRLTAAIEGNTLVLCNAFDLRETGSTMNTTTNAITSALWPESLKARQIWWMQPFGKMAEGLPNPLDVLLVSGMLHSPIYTHDNGGTICTDLMAIDFLANAPLPEATEK